MGEAGGGGGRREREEGGEGVGLGSGGVEEVEVGCWALNPLLKSLLFFFFS